MEITLAKESLSFGQPSWGVVVSAIHLELYDRWERSQESTQVP